MLLSQLVAALPGAHLSGPSSIDIRDIAHDSRQVTPGALFVALPSVAGGEDRDGVRYVPEAVRRGAIAVVTQSADPIAGVSTVQVPEARPALADIAAAFFGRPSEALHLFAVTGTDGKTTTTYLLEQIFAAAGYPSGLIGTVEVKIGEERRRNPDRMTTPESPDVQRLLRTMVDAGLTHVAMEASSHALALQRLRACQFIACALTNITADHIEFHGSWECYFQTKSSLFTELAPDRTAVLNRDDPHFGRLSRMLSGPLLSYSLTEPADIRAAEIENRPHGMCFAIEADGARAQVSLSLPGRFNVSNALAAAGLALADGFPLEEIACGLSQAQPPPGRQQRILAGQPFEVMIDYAHTMHAFRSLLETVRARTAGRVIAVFGAAGNRDRAKRPILAQIAAEYADLAVVTNEDPFGEEPEAIVDEILAGVPPHERAARFVREVDRGAAIRLAMRRARAGDTVVILGKGHEQSIVVNGHKEPWNDAMEARAAIIEALR